MRTEASASTDAGMAREPRRGFTLTELLVAIPIIIIVGLVAVTLMYNYTMLFIANKDKVAAARRAQEAILIVENTMKHAGLGFPSAGETSYKTAWNRSGSATVPWPATWGDVIVLSGDEIGDKGRESREIGFVYAASTRGKLKAPTAISDGNFNIELLDVPGLDFALPTGVTNREADMRFWYTAPASLGDFPFVATDYDATNRRLTAHVPGAFAGSPTLPVHQDVYKLKAAWVYVDEGHNLRFLDLTDHERSADVQIASKAGPASMSVEGIRAVRFYLTEDRKHIEFCVLAMGDSRDAPHARSIVGRLRDQWDELTDDDEGLYMEEFTAKWRLRNLEERS